MNLKRKAYDDAEVVHNLSRQQEVDDTLRFLYREHYSLLSHYVQDNSGSADDASDIFQEVMIAFVQLVQKGRFRGESSIRTFLYALNRNIWLNEIKKRGRALAREKAWSEGLASLPPGAPGIIEGRESSKALVQLMDGLGEACRTILTLYYYEERPMKEILQFLPYENEQVVRNKKHKCLKKLEAMIRENAALGRQLKNILYG